MSEITTSEPSAALAEQPSTPVQRSSRLKQIRVLISQRWPEYFIEIIVVIIGITISFSLSNFQSDAANKRLEETYLRGLEQDIKSDIQELEKTMELSNIVISSCEKLLVAGTSEKTSFKKENLIELVRAIASRPNFVSKNSTLSSLKNSANLTLIRDAELKNLLFVYDQQYESIKVVEFFEGQEMISLIAPFILKNVPLTRNGSAELLSKLDIRNVLTNLEFVNNVVLRQEKRREMLNNYTQIMSTLVEIQEKLHHNLGVE